MLLKPIFVTPKMPLKLGVSIPADGRHAGRGCRGQAHLEGARGSRLAGVMGGGRHGVEDRGGRIA